MPKENFGKYNFVDENDKAVERAVRAAGKTSDAMVGDEGAALRQVYKNVKSNRNNNA